MKLIGVCLAGATVITLSLACGNAEAATRTTAWETLVAVDPEVVDDERVGWEERVTLHALTPWQAEEYRRGADPGRLILADGRSLEEYLKARLAPEAGVYVGLTSPCRLFSGEWWPSGGIREVALRGHCGVPEEALSAVLDLRAEPLGVRPPRVKAWARDLPEPAEAVLEAEVDGPWTSLRTTTIVNLCVGEWCDGDLRIRSAGEALLEARVVGYFRPLSAADNPAPIVSFFTEGSSNNFFGTYAGSSVTNGIANSFFGAYAGNSVTSGGGNSFFGRSAGHHNTSGGENSFFGRSAGLSNTTEHNNTFVGAYSNGAGGISNATALGYRAQVSQSNSLVLGSIAGVNDATASVNVGIGTAAPQRQLHLKGGDAVFRMDRDVDTAAFMIVRTSGAGEPLKTFVLGTNASGGNNGEFIVNDLGAAVGGAGARRMTITNAGEAHFTGVVRAPEFVSTSSLRFKESVAPLRNAPDVVDRLQGVRFVWRETGRASVGLIGEEVSEVIPEVVDRGETGLDAPAINYSALVAVLVEALKAHRAEVTELRARVAELESAQTELIGSVQARLAEIERAFAAGLSEAFGGRR
jgi:hypothetical protein